MSVLRTIHPEKVVFGSVTWDKDSGGPVSIDQEITATPVLDSTGDAQTFQFLGFYNFVNNITLRLHDVSIYNDLQIGQHGLMTAYMSIPATSTPTQNGTEVAYPLGEAFITNFHINQVFGSVSEVVVNLIAQPPQYSETANVSE